VEQADKWSAPSTIEPGERPWSPRPAPQGSQFKEPPSRFVGRRASGRGPPAGPRTSAWCA